VNVSGSGTGELTFSSWIDADWQNSTVEADKTEARDENSGAGSDREPDGTDVTVATWVCPLVCS
jgi:hypothetical protein